MRLPGWYRTIYGALLLGAIMTLVCVLVIQGLPLVQTAELGTYDNYFAHRLLVPASHDILVVGLDHQSMQTLAQGRDRIPRSVMAEALGVLCKAHPKAIGIDFEYWAPSIYGARDDAALTNAVRRCHSVVLANGVESPASSNFIDPNQSATLDQPIPSLQRVEAAEGDVDITFDSDNVLRGIDLMQRGPGGKGAKEKLYPSFSTAVAGVALHQSPTQVTRGLPSHLLINWTDDEVFPTYPFDNVVEGDLEPSTFRNKIVLIIPAAIQFSDVKSTAVEPAMYGGLIHANALNTILNRNPIIPLTDLQNSLIVLLLGLFITILASRFGIVWSTVAAAAVAIGYFLAAGALLDVYRIWPHVATPEITIVLVYAVIMGFRFATEERQKRKTKAIFGQYVTPDVVETLVDAPDYEQVLAGKRQDISVLFVDIRGFTSMSEHMEPEKVVQALDVYLEQLTEAVQQQGGTINKYVGDELIGVWNAPNAQPDHPLRAVQSGLDMVARMDGINEQLVARELPMVRYGIGVNTGEAVVGVMGSSFRKQYDIIGDTMNTAARLCSGAGGGEIIIGQRTWEIIGDQLLVEETEPMRLKGKSDTIRTFAVLGLQEQVAPVEVPVPAQS